VKIPRGRQLEEPGVAICFRCGRHRQLVPERVLGQGAHRVCHACHAIAGACPRCHFVRPAPQPTPEVAPVHVTHRKAA
jgi:hypothetical protein